MAANPIDDLAEPHGGGVGSSSSGANLILPAFFVSAAALIIALIDPIHLDFQARPVETLALNALGIVLVGLGVLRRNNRIIYVGSGLLFVLVGLEATTQPAALDAPLDLIWPSRILIFSLVVVFWALFMSPPNWLRRGLLAFFVPTVLVLAVAGGPALGGLLFGWQVNTTSNSFEPYWLAVDSRGTLYASALNGGLIRVFDSTGSPSGTLRPSRAPQPPTPGPGILPNGMEEEIYRSGLVAVPTPLPGALAGADPDSGAYILDLCGVAVDEEDNLYTVSTLATPPHQVLKFDRDGSILAKYDLPEDVVPAAACLAVDAGHIYTSTFRGQVYILDRQGHVLRQVAVPFQPAGMAATGDGRLILVGPRSLELLDVNTGELTTRELDTGGAPAFAAVAMEHDGNILLADTGQMKILRLDPLAKNIIGAIGGPGKEPGQFGQINGIAVDNQGRIYVADWLHRVIQRFSAAGKIDAIWWAANSEPPTPTR